VLEQNEAFCYDFEKDVIIYYWLLKCPYCGNTIELKNRKWFCPECGYVEPAHSFQSFRCIFPCGHEKSFSIAYIVRDIPVLCSACDEEYSLPENIKSAWKNCTPDILSDFAVQANYFVRKNPWVVPAVVIGGPIAILAIALASSRSN
jgi:ribosomal protein S27AE